MRFSWTATIDVDGNMTTTPMVVEKPVENLDVPAAKKILSAAAKKLGVTLDKASLNAGAALLAQHGSGMYAKNLECLASYIAKAPLRTPWSRPQNALRSRISCFLPINIAFFSLMYCVF